MGSLKKRGTGGSGTMWDTKPYAKSDVKVALDSREWLPIEVDNLELDESMV